MSLSERLAAFSDDLTDAERANYKLLLGLATGGLSEGGVVPHTSDALTAFNATVAALSKLQPHKDLVSKGVASWVGRPSFMTDDLLARLQAESAEHRFRASRFDDHMLSCNAPFARSVGLSAALRELVSSAVGEVVPTGRANYIYYDQPGFGIDPHIDDEVFSLNTILLLQHSFVDERSALVLFPPDREPERIILEPGELVVFFADSVVHQRERMRQNESLSIVSFGFQVAGVADA